MSERDVLREHPLTQQMANMPEDVYQAYTKNNPMMVWLVDIAREIMGE